MLFNKKKTDGIILGHGVDLNGDKNKLQKIILSDKNRAGHFFCCGSTRVGKSRLAEHIIETDLRAGRSLVLVDPKGDIELFSKIVQVAYELGREDELIFINPLYPDLSAKTDPLLFYAQPEELVSHVVSGIDSKEAFFLNVAEEVTSSIVNAILVLQKHGNQTYLNFSSILDKCSHSGLLQLSEMLSNYHSEEAREVKSFIDIQLQSPPDFFSKISSSLRTVLHSLSTGMMGKIVGKAQKNNFIKQLEEEKRVIVVIQTGSLITRRTAGTLARVLISTIQTFVGRRFASGKRLSTPLSLVIDEFSNAAYMDIVELFNKAGGSGVWITALTQSIADLNRVIGPEATRQVLDNTNSKLFLRVNDPETADFISSCFSEKKYFSPIVSLNDNLMIREAKEMLVEPGKAMNLPARHFWYSGFEGYYRGITADVESSYLDIIFPDLTVKGHSN